MKPSFWTMHGAGNAFVVVDDRDGRFPLADAALIRRLCGASAGLGSDGLILLQRSARADGRMRFFNPDGQPARMCGNGARCLARLIHELAPARRRVTLETDNGLVAADILADGVRLALPPPSDCRLNRILDLAGRSCRVHTIDTGVPHAVLEAEDLESADLAGLGPAIRRHPMFAPQGANVNWMACTGPDAIAVRTYERGVEAETPACGTGITACALIAARLGRAAPPVRARCRHGDTLIVNFRLSADGFEGLTLQGPAAFTSAGRLEL